MLEYASIRFRLVCAIAIMFPTTIDAAARSARTSAVVLPAGSKVRRKTAANAPKAAVFAPVAMRPVTTVGAPS